MEFCAFIRLQYHFFLFIPITTSHMVLISMGKWRIFFDILNNDQILWEAFLVSRWFFFNTYCKLCELITLIASILMQCLTCHNFHSKVSNYITFCFRNPHQLFITLIVDVCQLLSPLTYDVIVVAHNFQCLPMTPSMICHLC
jgi:hypothetical protein